MDPKRSPLNGPQLRLEIVNSRPCLDGVSLQGALVSADVMSRHDRHLAMDWSLTARSDWGGTRSVTE